MSIIDSDSGTAACPVGGCDSHLVTIQNRTDDFLTYHCRVHGRVRWWPETGETERLDDHAEENH